MKFPEFLRKNEFPEKGIFKGVTYRIDGDSVMLTTSSGSEVQVGPDPSITMNMFDLEKKFVELGKSDHLRLKGYRPSAFGFEQKEENNTSSSGGSSEEIWGVTSAERLKLLELANQILVRYYRSRANKKR